MPTHRRPAPYLAGLLAAGAVAVVGFSASASGGTEPPPPAVTEALGRDLGLDRAGVLDRLRAEADARRVAERIQPLAEVTGVWFDEATGRLAARAATAWPGGASTSAPASSRSG